MQFDTGLVSLAVQGVTLLTVAGGFVRFCTRLESGLAEVRKDLAEHTAREEEQVREIRTRLRSHDEQGATSTLDRAVLRERQQQAEGRLTQLEGRASHLEARMPGHGRGREAR